VACIELDRARRAGPSPRGEQRRRCPPTRRCSLAPAGQPPLKLTGAATSAAPGAATLSAHRRVSTPYPLSSVVSGSVLPPGHKSRSHCPLSALLRHRMRCGCRGGSCCGAAVENPCKNQRCCGVAARQGGGREHRGPITRPLFDMGKSAAASCLLNKRSALRITGELVDSKVLLEGAYSADQRSAVRRIGDHTPHPWSDGASLTVVLLLSLGVWAVIWGTVTSVSAAL
jgi:hypothetical protein